MGRNTGVENERQANMPTVNIRKERLLERPGKKNQRRGGEGVFLLPTSPTRHRQPIEKVQMGDTQTNAPSSNTFPPSAHHANNRNTIDMTFIFQGSCTTKRALNTASPQPTPAGDSLKYRHQTLSQETVGPVHDQNLVSRNTSNWQTHSSYRGTGGKPRSDINEKRMSLLFFRR